MWCGFRPKTKETSKNQDFSKKQVAYFWKQYGWSLCEARIHNSQFKVAVKRFTATLNSNYGIHNEMLRFNWIMATSQLFYWSHFPVKDPESHGLKSNVKLKRCAFLIICSDSNRVKVNDWLSNYVFRELKRHRDSLLKNFSEKRLLIFLKNKIFFAPKTLVSYQNRFLWASTPVK